MNKLFLRREFFAKTLFEMVRFQVYYCVEVIYRSDLPEASKNTAGLMVTRYLASFNRIITVVEGFLKVIDSVGAAVVALLSKV